MAFAGSTYCTPAFTSTYKTPTVATRVGGIPDITGDGAYARLVPPRDTAALRTAIVETLADRALAQAQARQGQSFVRNAFASEVVAEQLHTVYAQAYQSK